MEAATPLRHAHVSVAGGRLHVDALTVDDECAVRVVREREQAGDDPVRAVVDAIEIGARVLDREQAGANADFVRAEMEKAARELNEQFGERAQAVSEQLDEQLQQVFGEESGIFNRALERHFSDDSSGAVQHRVREAMRDTLQASREELLRQFSSADGRNPLADFKQAAVAALKQASDQQTAHLRGLTEKLAALQVEVTKLHAEREKQLELGAERERGTAKGRSYEQAVYEAIDAIAVAQGDDCDSVGDLLSASGKVGDVVVAIDAACGPARGRIVFEAKNSRLSKPAALRELDEALAQRDAQFAVLVVPSEEKVPARMAPLREYNGDKLIACFDPDDGPPLALEVAYKLARARVLMARGGDEGLDPAAVRETIERAVQAMDQVRAVKQQLTGATTGIEKAKDVLDEMAGRVRGLLAEVDEQLSAAQAADTA